MDIANCSTMCNNPCAVTSLHLACLSASCRQCKLLKLCLCVPQRATSALSRTQITDFLLLYRNLAMYVARQTVTSYPYAWRGWHRLDIPGRSWSSYDQVHADTCTLALQLLEKELNRPYDGCRAQQRLDLISQVQFAITHMYTADLTNLQVPAAA